MPNDIPTLEDRRNFPAWQKAIKGNLTPFQWETVTWPEGGPPENPSYCLLWEKARAQAYNIIIQSIPDIILFGLGAHNELNALIEFYGADYEGYVVDEVPGGCPNELYKVICKWFNPTRAMIAAQVRCIANADPGKFEYAEEFVARVWVSKVCIDLDPLKENPVLEMLLCDAFRIPTRRWLRSWRRRATVGHFLGFCARYPPKHSHGNSAGAPPRGSDGEKTYRERQRGSRRNLRRHLMSQWLHRLSRHRDREGSIASRTGRDFWRSSCHNSGCHRSSNQILGCAKGNVNVSQVKYSMLTLYAVKIPSDVQCEFELNLRKTFHHEIASVRKFAKSDLISPTTSKQLLKTGENKHPNDVASE